MAVIGELRVNITAATKSLESGIARARGLLQAFGVKVKFGADGLKTFAAASGVAAGSLTALVYAVKRNADSIDSLFDSAHKVSATYDGLAGLQVAAQMTGTEFGAVQGALGKLKKNLAEVAVEGKGPAADALKLLGLNARNLIALGTDQALGEIAGKLTLVTDQAAKTSAAFALFGKGANEIVGTLKLGKHGLQDMAAEAQRFGLAIGTNAAADVGKLNDELDRLKMAGKGALNQITIALAPGTADILQGFTDAWTKKNASGGSQLTRAGLIAQSALFGAAGTAYGIYSRVNSVGRDAPSPVGVSADMRARGVSDAFGNRVVDRERNTAAYNALGRLVGTAIDKTLRPSIELSGRAAGAAAGAYGSLQATDRAAAVDVLKWWLSNPSGEGRSTIPKAAKAAATAGAAVVGVNRAIDATSQEGILALRGKPASDLKRVADNTDHMAEFLSIIADNTSHYPELEGFEIN